MPESKDYKDVFLSYSSADEEHAQKIAADLKKEGLSVWFDQWEIRIGDVIAQKVEQGLKNTRFVAVLLTKASVESGWVDREWKSKINEEIANKQVTILPLKWEDCDIPVLLNDKQYADFHGKGYDAAFKKLVNDVKAHSGELEYKPEIPETKKKRDKTSATKTVSLFAIIIAALAAIVTMALNGFDLMGMLKSKNNISAPKIVTPLPPATLKPIETQPPLIIVKQGKNEQPQKTKEVYSKNISTVNKDKVPSNKHIVLASPTAIQSPFPQAIATYKTENNKGDETKRLKKRDDISTRTSSKPLKVNADLMYLACSNEGAAIYEYPSRASRIVSRSKWMAPFVAIKIITDDDDREWYKVGKYFTIDKAANVGWMRKKDLLVTFKAIKRNGIYEKAIVVVHYDKNKKVIAGATVHNAPTMRSPTIGQNLTLLNIYYVFDKRDDIRSGETFFLLADEYEVINPLKPENTIIGWVNESRLFQWNTREAAEYDKTTIYKRQPVKIYETEEELRDIILGNKTPDHLEPIAVESMAKDYLYPSDPRFPIITKEREVNGVKMWNIGFVGDELIGHDEKKRKEVAALSKMNNAVDILFVIDGTGSMKKYKDSVIEAVKQAKQASFDYWREHFPGESLADLRFSISMYKDYSEPDYYSREGLQNYKENKIEIFIKNHKFTSGDDMPAVFNGILSTLRDSAKEMRKESFRAVILIGDMGNLGKSTAPDPKGHNVNKIVDQLKELQCDFYAIHVASEYYHYAITKFKKEAEAIISKLEQGKSEYIPITDPKKVREKIYEKIMTLLDQRYRLPRMLKYISKGQKYLGKQISGTILKRRAIEIMIRHGLNPGDFASRGVAAFAKGWVTPIEPETGIRAMKPVVLMNKNEVETLIAILGRLSRVKPENVQKGWVQAIEEVTGDEIQIDPESDIPALIIKKHLGIPVKSGVLNMTFAEIGRLSPVKIKEEFKYFKRKLFLLRAVVNEKNVELRDDGKGGIDYASKGYKKYWFGTRGSERVWLDMEKYLP